jgi:hypothetical protein
MDYASLQPKTTSGTGREIADTQRSKLIATCNECEAPILERLSVEEAHSRPTKAARRVYSVSTLSQLFIDLVLATPAVLFLAFAYLVRHHDGQHIEVDPVPALRMAARYGPTVFPIAFAAVMGNCLKAISAWNLERGITVLSLEYLLGSRTVFNAVTTPLKLRSMSALAPFLILLWALSPLGGQASLRLVEITPTTIATSSPVQYLEFKSHIGNTGIHASGADSSLAGAVGAFTAALSSPRSVKLGGQDVFGNIKIPLLEAFESSEAHNDSDGWYAVQELANVTYASILGLPVTGYSLGKNTTFTLQTSYLYTACTVARVEGFSLGAVGQWLDYMWSSRSMNGSFSNGRTLLIEIGHMPLHDTNSALVTTGYDPIPMGLLFTSFTWDGVTKSTCTATTSHAEVDVSCHNNNCTAVRARRSTESDATPIPTVLDFNFVERYGGSMIPWYFFDSFVNATDTPWDYVWPSEEKSSPLEIYFTEPDVPYTMSSDDIWHGDVIWPIGDRLFSHRFSQLINSWWIANAAPFEVSGNFNPLDPTRKLPPRYQFRNATASVTPDLLVLRCHRVWLTVLVVASLTMFLAGILAAILGALRKGPDVLDYSTSLLRDSHFVNLGPLPSTEDAIGLARKLKNVTVVLGDSQPDRTVGRMAIGTTDSVKAASRLEPARRYW